MSGAEEREAMEFDVLIVGGGPAGLAAAIRLKQVAPDATVCLVEKGSEIGAHILSGAVLEPRALDELIPDWRDDPPALATPAGEDKFMLLTATKAYKLPTPPQMNNHGNYIVSLGNVCRWLGAKAEALGVEIYPGFAASETIIEDGQVKGVVAGVAGIRKDGTKGPNYEPGMELRATYTLFAEGCRGSLTKKLQERYDLRDGVAPQTYALGMKELWEIPKERHTPGLVWHSTGWPVPSDTYGGSWLYMLGENLVSIGFVVGLDYPNPWLSPFDEFQRFKTHPEVREDAGGRQAHRLRRPRAERGRHPGDPEAGLPGRHADRRHRRLPQRAEDQGHAYRDEVRHGGGRCGRRGAGRGGPPGGARQLPRSAEGKLGLDRAAGRPQHPPGLRQVRPLGRAAQCRARHLRLPRQGALDLGAPRRTTRR